MKKHAVLCAISILALALGIVACGGGGGGGGGGPTTVLVTGTVLDSRNDPVEAATVVLTSDPVTAVTDAAGAFSATVTVGDHFFTISKNSYPFYSWTISIAGSGAVNLGNLLPSSHYFPGGEVWFADSDGDGYSPGGKVIVSEAPVDGYAVPADLTATIGDCDDEDPSVHSGSIDLDNGIDDDCDTVVDDLGTARILLVDDDGGMNNFVGDSVNYPDVDPLFISDLIAQGCTFDLVRTNGLRSPATEVLKAYPVVLWITGASWPDETDFFRTFTTQDQQNLAAYLSSGGSLMLVGPEILNGIADDIVGTFDSTSFVGAYLGVLDFEELADPVPSRWESRAFL